MPNGLLQIAQAAENPDFQARVKASMYQLAAAIAVSGATDETPAGKRRNYVAMQVASTPDLYVKQLSWMCAALPAVQASVRVDPEGKVTVTVDDSVIMAATQATWNTLAGSGVS